ncbi:hypothetical protein [Simplicispira psychrophila]|uniref:hypothetical protein n=1 Tax=Simplicispira psychrophila TaxID=80882 RepID=UPI0005634AC8|nr:hypothetical protein [Simplicispira psychrophila]
MRQWLPPRLRREGRDLIELVLVPGLAAVMPWRWCFAIFKRLAQVQWLYSAACSQALAQAQEHGQVTPADAVRWLATRRLVTLVDHADHYLAVTRSDVWMQRHLQVQGHWPKIDSAGIFCTFHWGAGMWGLRHAHSVGLQGHALVAAMEGNPFAGRRVLHWYVRARTRSVGRALGRAPLVVSGSLRPVIQALRRNEQVLAAVDVPSDQVDSSVEVRLLGMPVRMPKGLLRLAVTHGIPVAVYVTGLDIHTGQRYLRITPLGVWQDLDALAAAVFSHLEAALRQDAAAWHFWAEAPRFFSAPPP